MPIQTRVMVEDATTIIVDGKTHIVDKSVSNEIDRLKIMTNLFIGDRNIINWMSGLDYLSLHKETDSFGVEVCGMNAPFVNREKDETLRNALRKSMKYDVKKKLKDNK